MRKLIISLITLLALGFMAAPSAWSAEARTLTAADKAASTLAAPGKLASDTV